MGLRDCIIWIPSNLKDLVLNLGYNYLGENGWIMKYLGDGMK